MKPCPRCKMEIPDGAKACPHCGADFYTLRMRRIGTILVVVTLVAVIATCATG
ncbi:MAG: zinc-ribbon domain-containing protein [Allosphingosinicella sp.]